MSVYFVKLYTHKIPGKYVMLGCAVLCHVGSCWCWGVLCRVGVGVCCAMSCWGVLCYVVLGCAVLCRVGVGVCCAMSCWGGLCYDVLGCAVLSYVVLGYDVLWRVGLCGAMTVLDCAVLCRVGVCGAMSCGGVLCYVLLEFAELCCVGV